jgi:hypothetical protein
LVNWLGQREGSASGCFYEELDLGFSFAAVGLQEIVYFSACVAIDELQLISVEVDLEQLFVEFDEAH